MARTKNENGLGGITQIVSESLKKSFDLDGFKKSKSLTQNVKFKPQKWIPLSKAFQDITSMPGIPMGHITLLRGHSDTGKTTALLEAAVSAQQMGILPVVIVSEMKWSWEHAQQMGFKMEPIVDEETGETVDYKGFFVYVDRGSLNTIEDIAAFIADLLNEQAKGKLPFDLCFLWDSVGSIPCAMSVEKEKNNNEWNAGAMSVQFGNFINQKIVLSRKENQMFTNTLVAVNKVWVEKPENPHAQPKMKNKGGNTMFFDSSLVVTFGNVTNSGTSKIKATKNGKDVEFAKRTRISVDKNHITGVQTKGVVIMTVHGFIEDDSNAINSYKKEHSKEWLNILGSGDFDIVEDSTEFSENLKDINDYVDAE
jgi:RecA/RadA recombinase